MKKKRLKLKVKNLILFIFIFIFIGLIIYSSFRITHYIYNTNATEELNQELTEFIQISEDNEDDITVDFNKLKEENSDTVAWLRVNNTNISYPVVKSKDNDYYLKHNFKKKWSESGWIFTDFKNKVDGTDQNLVIFGHAMKNKTMFGDLDKSLENEWLNDETNRKIQLIINDEVQIYQIFSIYKIEAEDYYITTAFGTEDYKKFVTTVKDRSIYDFKVNNEDINHILTLSTCYGNNNTRLVIHAYRIENNHEIT